MSNDDLILEHIRAIREDMRGIKNDLNHMKEHGCQVGAVNKQRLDAMDKRAAAAGGILGAIISIVVAALNHFFGGNQ